jgi:hypothetical protein
MTSLKSDTLLALSALDDRLLKTSSGLETQLSRANSLISELQAQVKTLETLDNSTTLTLMDMAARKLETELLIATLASTSQSVIDSTSALMLIDMAARKSEADLLTSTIASTSQSMIDAIKSIDVQVTNITNVSNISYGSASIPAFADGGSHLGGIRLVGERGPELEYTGPSHITPNHGIAGAFADGNREMVIELSALREEVKELRLEQRRQHHESARYQRDTADTLTKFDQVGIKTMAEA